MPDGCFLCAAAATIRSEPERGSHRVECAVCGKYRITREASEDSHFDRLSGRYILSGLIRQATEEHRDFPLLTGDNVLGMMSESHLPPRRLAQLDLLLEHVEKRAETFGAQAKFNPNHDYPLAFAKDPEELDGMLRALRDQGWITLAAMGGMLVAQLTVKGWARIDELHPRRPGTGNQCFVAMWFNKPGDPIDMQAAYDSGIWPAIEATGYKAYRVDRSEHNNKIDDQIVAEIRRSRLLVADFTGARGGVYFEAGLAMGLNVPVIWSCHKDWMKELHFDTRQYNHIEWETPEELREKLENRIWATHPLQPTGAA